MAGKCQFFISRSIFTKLGQLLDTDEKTISEKCYENRPTGFLYRANFVGGPQLDGSETTVLFLRRFQ